MSLAIQLRKMRMFRDWLDYQRAYEDRDEEAEMWNEFVQQWETDKALNRLAENFEAHDHPDNVIHCPVCDYHCEIDDDGTADCDPCVIRWTVVDTGTFKYLDAEEAKFSVTPAMRNSPSYTNWEEKSFDCLHDWQDEEFQYMGDSTYEIMAYCPTCHSTMYLTAYANQYGPDMFVLPGRRSREDFFDAEDYGVKNVWMSESFRDWADDELRTHGENVSFEKWSQEEFEDEPAHRHANGQLSFVQWARDEINEEHHNAEEFCAECGCSHKDAETFDAETANGNQVFNSCWKCGSGQHLHQISRYPASPDEIAGVGGDPEQASDNWLSGRPVQR